MEAMLNIGAKLDKETAENASESIEKILKAVFEYRVSDKVLMKSFDVLKSAVTVQHVNISGCTFDNDQSKRVEVIVPPEFTEESRAKV